jgi:hypothetical protein
MRLICDAYGLRGRGGLLETILWWQDRGQEPQRVALRQPDAPAG